MRKIRVGDNVKVMSGKDAGKEGVVTHIVKTKGKSDKVVVKGLNIVKKSQKPNQQMGIAGGIVEFEKPLDISNVMLVDGGKAVRVGIKVDEKTGKKTRINKKTNKKLA